MTYTTKNGIITEIKATKSEFTNYVDGGLWIPQSKVFFFKQKDGYCMTEVSINKGDKLIVKVIILSYFV